MQFAVFFAKLAVLGAVVLGLLFVNPTPLSTNAPDKPRTASAVKTVLSLAAMTENSTVMLKGEERDRVNILFVGLPGEGNSAPDLTDTLIVASIKPSTHQVALISLPRDLLVRVEQLNYQTKINALFRMNERNPELLEQKITEITGEPVDYFVALDISAVEHIVDALGGLNVEVPEDIHDTAFPTKDFGVETFSVEKGWRYFDGATAQKYLRTRHSAGGDFVRMRQQQAVLEALRKKVFGLNILYDFPTILSLYGAVAAHTQTNLAPEEIQRLYHIAKTVSYDTVKQVVVDGDPKDPNALLVSTTVRLGGKEAFVLVPKKGTFDYSDIRELVINIFKQ
ncbi:MAG: LCP family protein [Patescibacteria group bacterium]